MRPSTVGDDATASLDALHAVGDAPPGLVSSLDLPLTLPVRP